MQDTYGLDIRFGPYPVGSEYGPTCRKEVPGLDTPGITIIFGYSGKVGVLKDPVNARTHLRVVPAALPEVF
jgi:hypothetical protein